MKKLFTLFLSVFMSCSLALALNVDKYGIFENAFTDAGAYSNPYLNASATVTFTNPSGITSSIPMFWDGGDTWRVRFSPDAIGTWTWSTSSTDNGLNSKSGSFTCVASTKHGGIRINPSYPYNMEYQDGTPFWWFGDTEWTLFVNISSENHNRNTVFHYIDVRAAQGVNVVHSTTFRPEGNEGGQGFTDLNNEVINPAYFQEVDLRLAYLNSKGITSGMLLAWGTDRWKSFPSDAARQRYAKWFTARYSAYNVYFILAGEYNEISGVDWNAMGNVVMNNDPHNRMRGIHGTGSTSGFASQSWTSFGEYRQDQSGSHANMLSVRTKHKPVVNGEFCYYRKDSGAGALSDLTTARNYTWNIAMAGAYFVAGFGNTYRGGTNDGSLYDVDEAGNDDYEEDLGHVRSFFTSLDEWWKLSPTDASVTSSGTAYCLANTGVQYVVYVKGTTSSNSLSLGTSTSKTYSVKRFNPSTGVYTTLSNYTGLGPVSLTNPDNNDWVYVVKEDNVPNPVITSPLTSVKFSPGASITANGSGVNLSWKVSSVAAGTIKTGTGASITFTVPLTAADNSKIKVELTGGTASNEVVFNEYTVLDDTPVITNPITGNAVINQPFSLQLVATGNGTPLTWSSTTLPSGLSLSSGGLLTGTLSAVGTSTFSVTVTDADGDVDTETFTLEVLDAAPCTSNSYVEAGGEVVIEAENHYTASLNGDVSGANWVVGTSYAGFSGTGYVGMPDANLPNATSWATGSQLSYNIDFKTTGTYNIWVRRYSTDSDSDSGNIGFDGVQLGGSISNGSANNVWGWDKHATTLSVTTAGVKTFNLRRREDGYSVDKIIITTNATTPTGNGPAESVWCVGTSASSLSSPLLSIYPNPANNSIRISNPSLCDQLIIYDVLSREQVNAKVNGEGQIDISSLSANIYMVRLLKDGKVVDLQKLIKR